MWGLGEWSFEDLTYRRPSHFLVAEAPEAYQLALQDSDRPEADEEVQVTILSRKLPGAANVSVPANLVRPV